MRKTGFLPTTSRPGRGGERRPSWPPRKDRRPSSPTPAPARPEPSVLSQKATRKDATLRGVTATPAHLA